MRAADVPADGGSQSFILPRAICLPAAPLLYNSFLTQFAREA
jgi:hypothetical protein